MDRKPKVSLRRYSPDLCLQMATCDANYIRLLKLLPDMNAGTSIELDIPAVDNGEENSNLSFCVKVVECFKYTSTIEITQCTPQAPDYFKNPEMQIRVYHDASTAEVVSYQHIRYFKSRYEMPNPDMYQPDEKQQLNVFLGEWLNLCLSRGVSNRSLVFDEQVLSLKQSGVVDAEI